MEQRFARAPAPAPVLSPLEESSEEVSRDSGIVSQSTSTGSTASMISEALSAGEISRSPSVSDHRPHGPGAPTSPISPTSPVTPITPPSPTSPTSSSTPTSPSPGPGGGEGPVRDLDQDDEVLKRTALGFSSYIKADAREEIQCLEKSLEEMLTRVDQFVGMLDMVRDDSSQMVNVSLPQIYRKSEDMRHIYRKIDNLEAFVRMVSVNVDTMEQQVMQLEGDARTLPAAFRKIFRTVSVPGFLNKPTSPRRGPPQHRDCPAVFSSDDFFPPQSGQ